MKHPPEISFASIVFIGKFSPSVFQPAWFALHDLLGQTEVENAEVKIIHSAFTSFVIDTFQIQVAEDRFAIEIRREPLIQALDLAVKTFTDVLPYTPLTRMGINRNVHVRCKSISQYNQLGDMLAPKEPWGAWGRELMGPQDTQRTGGTVAVVQEQAKVPPAFDHEGHIRAKVEPSREIKPGIFMEVNEEFRVSPDTTDAAAIIRLLEQNWERSIARSESIIDAIVEHVV